MLKRQICSIRVVGKLGPQRDTRVFHTFSLRMSCLTYCEAFCTKTILVTRRRRREFCRKTFLVKHEQKGKGVENPASLTWGKLWGVNTIISQAMDYHPAGQPKWSQLFWQWKIWFSPYLTCLCKLFKLILPVCTYCSASVQHCKLLLFVCTYCSATLQTTPVCLHILLCMSVNCSCLSAQIALHHGKLLLFVCTYCSAWV